MAVVTRNRREKGSVARRSRQQKSFDKLPLPQLARVVLVQQRHKHRVFLSECGVVAHHTAAASHIGLSGRQGINTVVDLSLNPSRK